MYDLLGRSPRFKRRGFLRFYWTLTTILLIFLVRPFVVMEALKNLREARTLPFYTALLCSSGKFSGRNFISRFHAKLSGELHGFTDDS